MKKSLLVIGGLSLLGFTLYTYFKYQFNLLLNYEWKISSLKIKKFSINEINIDLGILFTSKADIETEVKKIYLDLFLEGKNVGYVTEQKPFIVPARGSHNIILDISVNPKKIIFNISDIVLNVGKRKDVMFKIDGYADIKSGIFKATLPIKYETTLKEYLK
jgi:hypothetical protein